MLDAWLDAATYRESFELVDHTYLIGPCPPRHARTTMPPTTTHNIDRHLAGVLHLLDGDELDRLEHDHQQILDSMPTFDPRRLDQTHRTRDRPERQHHSATDPVDVTQLRTSPPPVRAARRR